MFNISTVSSVSVHPVNKKVVWSRWLGIGCTLFACPGVSHTNKNLCVLANLMLVMDYYPIQGGVEILLDASYYAAYDKNILELQQLQLRSLKPRTL